MTETPLRVTEVASLLGLHPHTVKRIPPDELPYFRVARRGDRRYDQRDVLPTSGPGPEMREFRQRTRGWHDEWRPYSTLSPWRMWVWAAIAADYRLRHPRRVWRWWVDEYMAALLTRRRIQRRLDLLN